MSKNCLNCNTELHSNYCPNCGQKASVHKYSLKHFMQHDVVHGIWHVDSGILFTIKALASSPGHSIRGYLQGKRVKYFNYLSLLIIIIGFSHFLNSYVQIKLSDLFVTKGNTIMADFEAFSYKYPKIILILTIPFYAVFTFIWFKRAKLNLTEHFVLNSYKTCGELLIVTLFTVCRIFVTNKNILIIIYSVTMFASYCYTFWFYRQFFSAYDFSKKSLIFRSVLCIFSYMFFSFLIGVVIGISKLIQDKVL